MGEFVCDQVGCTETAPHDHGFITSPIGVQNTAIIYRVEDPRAEVRDPDTGEVIFPAVKGPLKVIAGGLSDQPSEGERS